MSMTTTTKGLKLDTAVILTTTGLFGWRDAPQENGVGPLTQVGGMSLFMRTLLTLQRARFTNVMVLSGDEVSPIRRSLQEDSRIAMTLRWLPMREFPPDDPRTWQALGAEVRGACLVLGARAVFGHELLVRLREELTEDQVSLVVCRANPPEWRTGSQSPCSNPLAEHRGNRLVALHDRPKDGLTVDQHGEWCVATDMVVVPATLLSGAGASVPARKRARVPGAGARASGRTTTPDTLDLSTTRLLQSVPTAVYPIRALLERAAVEGVARVLATSPETPQWYREVRRPADHKAAEQTLLQSLKGDLEGYVDRHFNRRISAVLTRYFLKLGVSANVVTMISMIIGLFAAAAIAQGNYAAGVIGALLLQLSAIVDCCDGEIARLTFTESSFG